MGVICIRICAHLPWQHITRNVEREEVTPLDTVLRKSSFKGKTKTKGSCK